MKFWIQLETLTQLNLKVDLPFGRRERAGVYSSRARRIGQATKKTSSDKKKSGSNKLISILEKICKNLCEYGFQLSMQMQFGKLWKDQNEKNFDDLMNRIEK